MARLGHGLGIFGRVVPGFLCVIVLCYCDQFLRALSAPRIPTAAAKLAIQVGAPSWSEEGLNSAAV